MEHTEGSKHAADAPSVELGIWIGRGQAFGLIASRCSAAQVDCLKRIREDRSHESLGLSWEEFCQEYAGISRSYAERLIQRLEEFGAAYFQLSGVMHISPDSYRLIATSVSQEGIEIDGEVVAIAPENAARIKTFVRGVRAEAEKLRDLPPYRPNLNVTELNRRLESCLYDMRQLAGRNKLDMMVQASLRGVATYTIRELKRICDDLTPV